MTHHSPRGTTPIFCRASKINLLEVITSFKYLGFCSLHTLIAFTSDPPWLVSGFAFIFGPSSWNINHPASIKLWDLCLRAMHCSIECPGVPPCSTDCSTLFSDDNRSPYDIGIGANSGSFFTGGFLPPLEIMPELALLAG